MECSESALTILGGGVAGLAVAHFAARRGLAFELFEAASSVGGNCRTLSLGPFRFDTGAHRIHDRDPLVAREVRSLLGDALHRVTAPSHVFSRGRLVAFPLRPLDLARHLGARGTLRAGLDLLAARARLEGGGEDFESHAVRAYGRTIAREFLLDYSEKLWGLPSTRLAPLVAGRRLQGLGLRSVLLEALRGGAAATRHLDGSFLYPRGGFGRLAERLADAAGRTHLHCGAPVRRLLHDGRCIRSIEVEGRPAIPCTAVVSTLPLPMLVDRLDPPLPLSARDLAGRLRFRDVVLVALALRRATVSASATIYFPEKAVPFNRVYEPRNRCPEMSPQGHTMLVAELPAERAAGLTETALVALVRDTLAGHGWISPDEVVDAAVHRLPNAYPLLERGCEQVVASLLDELGAFRNLWLGGRNGLFAYTHVHDLLRSGHELVETIAERLSSPGAAPVSVRTHEVMA